MKRLLLVSMMCCAVFGCKPTPAVTPDQDAGDEEVDYVGDTQGGQIPIPPLESEDLDGGTAEVDRTCCEMIFSVDDAEGPRSWGKLVFDQIAPGVDGGYDLQFANGGWSTMVCLPLQTSLQYHFELAPLPLPADAGPIDWADAGLNVDDLIDAGFLPADYDGGIPFYNPTIERKTNASQPLKQDGLGQPVNVVGPYNTCVEADAGVGMLP